MFDFKSWTFYHESYQDVYKKVNFTTTYTVEEKEGILQKLNKLSEADLHSYIRWSPGLSLENLIFKYSQQEDEQDHNTASAKVWKL